MVRIRPEIYREKKLKDILVKLRSKQWLKQAVPFNPTWFEPFANHSLNIRAPFLGHGNSG